MFLILLYLIFSFTVFAASSSLDWLNSLLGHELTPREEHILWVKFSSYGPSIARRLLSIHQAKILLKSIRTVIQTQTIVVMKKQGYLFDGLLGPSGASKAILYRVLKETRTSRQVLCGKVYLSDSEYQRTFQSEINTSSEIHEEGRDIHPNIVRYSDVLNFEHVSEGNRPTVALIMPLFSMSLQDELEAKGAEVQISFDRFLELGSQLLSAGKRFEEKNLVHCDIKPGNIMLSDEKYVVIDFGAVCFTGQAVREYTQFYSLNADTSEVNSLFDLNCIIVTLAQCFMRGFIVRSRSRAGLLDEMQTYGLNNPDNAEHVTKCISCLDCESCIEAYSLWMDN
jgi:serine/threonine protein kinase